MVLSNHGQFWEPTKVQKFQKLLSKEAPEEESNRLVPHRFLGDSQFNKNNYKQALGYYKKALVQDPHDISIMQKMGIAYIWTEKFNDALNVALENVVLDTAEQFCIRLSYHDVISWTAAVARGVIT